MKKDAYEFLKGLEELVTRTGVIVVSWDGETEIGYLGVQYNGIRYHTAEEYIKSLSRGINE